MQLSRSAETLCAPAGPSPPPGPPAPPTPPAPPAPPVAGAFVLVSEADPSLCVTALPNGKHAAVAAAPCTVGNHAQAWVLQAAGKGGAEGIAAATGTASANGGSFLKVAEKDYPSGHACDAGNALTLGGATSGKVDTFFTWGGSPDVSGPVPAPSPLPRPALCGAHSYRHGSIPGHPIAAVGAL